VGKIIISIYQISLSILIFQNDFMNKYEDYFKSKALLKYDMIFFTKANALQVIQECKEKNITILGIDGFYLYNDKIQPSMEHSIDFRSISYNSKGRSTYDNAIKFLNSKDENLFLKSCLARLKSIFFRLKQTSCRLLDMR
jgi:hypothetical protein